MFSVLATVALASCSKLTTGGSTSTGTGSGGAGGAGGACPMGPQAMFDVTITAQGGDVPPNTTIDVSWSAGEEPRFSLDEPSTWMTIEQANVICDVDATKPPPEHLAALVCHLWTTGATNVVVSAKGYATFDKTYASMFSDHCKALVPTAISIELEPTPKDDAGPT